MRILTGLLRRSGRFNGAGMFPSQKCGCDVRTGWYNIASMGPGCFHPRNTIDNTLAWARCGLQWGRDVSIPEIATPLSYSNFKDLRARPRALLHSKPNSHRPTKLRDEPRVFQDP